MTRARSWRQRPIRRKAGPFVGRDAVMQQLNQARAAFDSDSAELLGDLVAVNDRVIARMGWHGLWTRSSERHGVDRRVHHPRRPHRQGAVHLGSR